MPSEDPERTVRAYYDALDDGDYDRLAGLLDADFVQVRPDRTFEGREAFVSFMRDERPVTDSTHQIAAVYRSEDAGVDVGRGRELAARGTVRRPDESVLVAFVDAFTVEDGVLTRLETYTR